MNMDIMELIRRADAGDVDAMVALVDYICWDEGRAEDFDPLIKDKVLGYINKAIAEDNNIAMNQLGAMYNEGIIVAKDPEKAMYWYKEAADRGNPLAMCNLAYGYYYGTGVPQDYEKAYIYFTKSAVLGQLDSYYKVGDMFMYGYYVEKDIQSALTMYRRAFNASRNDLDDWGSQQVYSSACLRLGKAYKDGIGVDADSLIAEKYLAEAHIYFQERLKKKDAYAQSGYEESRKLLFDILQNQ